MFNIRIAVSNADAAAGAAAAAASAAAAGDPAGNLPTSLPFTVGLHDGVVHLYRRVPTREQAEAGEGGDEPYEPASCDTLAILAVPPAMAVSDLCAFLGDHLAHVRELRLVRRRAEMPPAPPAVPPVAGGGGGGGGRKRPVLAAATGTAAGERALPHAGATPPPPPPPPPPEDSAPTLALLRFATPAEAAAFYGAYQGRPFTALEPGTVCRLLPVRSVEFLGRGEGGEGAALTGAGGGTTPAAATGPAPPPPGQTELPACPVCLERLDDHITGGGTLTTVCGHVFHSSCMLAWAGASCPVCRHCTAGSATSTRCCECGSAADLWICLLCGHVGCGRYRAGHAARHFHETSHTYALDLEQSRVWDYSADAWVHRLISSAVRGTGKGGERGERGWCARARERESDAHTLAGLAAARARTAAWVSGPRRRGAQHTHAAHALFHHLRIHTQTLSIPHRPPTANWWR